jgi:hypothetical protein
VGLVFGITRWQTRTLSISLALAMTLSLWGCGGNSPTPSAPIVKPETRVAAKSKPAKLSGKIAEASPPEVIQQLRELLEKYQPQVSIATPKSNEVLQDNSVSVQFNVKDLPIFKDAKLGLGPHLHLFLDDQPYQAVYDASQPVILKDLAPGTHTIRAFASRPWHESFKNDGAYAQTTFHVFTKTPSNNPNPDLPLLTYSRPQAAYGAEPVMLDFYLTNAPLHLVAQEDAKDDVPDWRVQVTVNGDRFVLDRWQPIYLKGFKPGKNWIQLEYIDEKGNPVQNVFNNTARLFTYEPSGKDTLSKLTRGELSLAEARGIVDPNYKPEAKPVETPTPVVTPEPSPSPIPVVPIPKVEEKPVEPEAPKVEAPKVEENIPETVPAPVEETKPKGGFFSRFKRSTPEPAPSVAPSSEPIPSELPAVEEPEEPKVPEVVVPKVEEAPEVKETPKGRFFDRFKQVTPEPTTSPEPTPTEAPVVKEPEESKTPEIVAPKVEEAPEAKAKPKGGFFDQFKRSTPEPTSSPEPVPTEVPTVEKEPETTTEPVVPVVPVVPEVKETPTSEAKKAPKGSFFDRFKRPSVTPSISPSPVPTELPAPEIPKAVKEKPEETNVPEVVVPPVKETPKGKFFDRFPRPTAKPSVAPSPVPIPNELAEPEEEQPAIVKPEAKETPKGEFFNQFKRPGFMKKAPSAPIVPPIPAPDMIEPPVEEKEEIKPQPTPAIKEAPKGKFFDRLKLPEVKPSPSPNPVPDVLSVPETAVEEPEVLEPETPKPDVKETPQETVFERFRRPAVKPSEPPVVQEPKVEPEETAKPEPETPKPNVFDRFQAPAVKPSPSPVVEEPAKSEPSETSEFDARSELERRLGVPLKPPIPTPEKPTPQPVVPKREEPKPAVKFEVPKSSELFKRRETNPFLKSSEKPVSENTSEPEKTPEATPVE